MSMSSLKCVARTKPRMRAAIVLKMCRSQSAPWVSASDIASKSGWGSHESMTACLRKMRAYGLVEVKEKRPLKYRITDRGLIWMGSYPTKEERPDGTND